MRAANGSAIDVLRDFRLSLQAGRLAALLGPSGCGKTTFLKCIAGLDTDYDGHIALPQAARLAFVFQEPRLLPWRTVEENIRLAAPDAGAKDIDQLLETLHLSGHRRHFPGELSLGLARRVSLARAFAVKPDLLLLDEPFVSLDATLAGEMRAELKSLLARQPVTALLVTHDVAEAAELADKVCLLSPRPAGIIAEFDIARPREHRSVADAADIAADIAARMAGPPSRA